MRQAARAYSTTTTRRWASSRRVNSPWQDGRITFGTGVSKATFGVVEAFTSNRLDALNEHQVHRQNRLSMKENQRRFCDQG